MRKCLITGKCPIVGRSYSNKTRATKFNPTSGVVRRPNLQTKKIFVEELNKKIKVKASIESLIPIEAVFVLSIMSPLFLSARQCKSS